MYGNNQHQPYIHQRQQYPPHLSYERGTTPHPHSHPVNSSGYCYDCQSYTMTSQWYHQAGHHAAPSYNYLMDTPPSNSREQRNKAEKQRRDKLNSFITELACLVPMVFNSPKRMDKTSILRLSATHLRIYQTLNGDTCPKLDVPKNVDQNIIENLVCDELNGFLLILTATGKVVFVSQTVETLLGHLQTDLMGQTIFTITAPEDHDRLRLYITQASEDSPASSSNNHYHQQHISDHDWRKYFNIRLKRAGPRSEPPVYESVNVMGMQRPTANANRGGEIAYDGANGGGTADSGAVVQNSSANSDMWVFFVRIYRPEVITNMLMEASKDEYVTRHYVDGKIIDCDQRISLIAGYMIEEINGLSAFNFMHKEDVHWVIVALRQMYDRGESRGNSCYRLQSKTGQFIYLRTFGFLEADSSGTVETFICVNSLVSEREGLQLIREMKERYSALVYPGSNSPLSITEIDNGIETVEDPQTIEVAIENLLHNLPTEADVTYQELTNSAEKKLKAEPQDYETYSPAIYSNTNSSDSCYKNDNAHAQQGVKRPATGNSPYNNSAKYRKVTKLLMRPSSNPSAVHRTTPPMPVLSQSPTISSTNRQQQTTPPIFIKQEDPPSPQQQIHSYASPPPPQSPQTGTPLLQPPVSPGYVQQQQELRVHSSKVRQQIVASPSGQINMGASPERINIVAASPIIMPPTPLTPTMDHSYPYRPQISPGSNHILQARSLLSPPMSNASHASNNTMSPVNTNPFNNTNVLSPQESNSCNNQDVLAQQLERQESVTQYNEGEAKVTRDAVSGTDSENSR